MQKKILHICTDDKFTDYVIKQFMAPEMVSEFVLVPSNNAKNLVSQVDQCKIVCQGSSDFDVLLNSLNQYSAIVLHGMFWGKWQVPILQHIPKSVKVAWVFWGGDLYARQDLRNSFYSPISAILNRLHKRKISINIDTSWEIALNLYNRVDYCITSLYEEFEYAQRYTKASFQYFWYSYYSVEDTIGEALLNSQCDGSNIWIGNSAALVNNHFDILWHLLKKGMLRKLKGCQVVMPLSYGEPWVRNLVKKVGAFLFGKRLQTLEQYIPRNEYNALMLSCSTMVIGYLEPAANGNIMTALWLGMRVYLSEKSMAYTYYKRIGCHIFSIEHDLNRKNKDCFARLSYEDVIQNRTALMQEYGKRHTDQAVRELVEILTH